MTTKLRLLLDESVTQPLIDEIRSSSGLSAEVKAVIELMPQATDNAVVEYAKKDDRIVVTTEKRMNERTFPICTHPGIIVLGGVKRHEAIQGGLFQRFMKSGRRREARHAVTYLTEDLAHIVSEGHDETFPI